jgi:DNA-binding CsgD family transcriptional regulator
LRPLIYSPAVDVPHERAEREIAAHVAVYEALSAWQGLEQGARRLLCDLGGALGFTAGTLWVPRGDVLAARVTWTADPEERRQDARLRRGEGLPGRVWQVGRPLQSATDDGDRCTGIALPAVRDGKVLAVVELESDHHTHCGERLLRSLSSVGAALGTFLDRRRGQLDPRLLSPREQEVIQLAAEGMTGRQIAAHLVLSPATIKTHFEHAYEKLGVSDRAAAVARALRAGLIE